MKFLITCFYVNSIWVVEINELELEQCFVKRKNIQLLGILHVYIDNSDAYMHMYKFFVT